MTAALLCDVDGTLVDTNYLHTVAWWQAFAEAGRPRPMVDIRAAIGMGADQLLPRLQGTPDDSELGQRLRERHSELFRPYWTLLQPLPGAADLVRACAGRGLRVVLATSAGAEELTALRRAIDADDAIAAATNADQVSSTKPAPDIVHQALEAGQVERHDAVFVGDTVWDVIAAHRAGLPCVAVTCGGTTEAELRAAGADEVYSDPATLLANFAASPLARLTP